MHKLEKALRMAMVAHSGQTELNGLPYIFHPIRVSERVNSIDEKVVALLHDVVEDTATPLDVIYDEFGTNIGNAIEAITKGGSQSYDEYIKEVGDNHLARVVKLADLKDNMDTSRLLDFTDKDKERIIRYQKAYSYLI